VISAAENELLTQTGAQTPVGQLLRRYWHVVAGVAEMEGRWTKRVRILGEDLVLFRDRSGRYGLIAEQCPHRRASLAYGIPEADGLRCPYHGWKFDGTGRCLDQPNEPAESTFRDKVWTSGYPVQEMGGMLWAFLGPQPAPLLPRWDGFVVPGTIRTIGKTRVRCNWLQIQENSVDPVHTEWLHGALFEFVKEQQGTPVKVAIARHHAKIAFDEFPFGIVKRRLMEGQSEDSSDWRVGHPIVFPNLLAVGSGGGHWRSYQFQIRVPIDDDLTEHYWYNAYVPPAGVDVPRRLLDEVTVYDAPACDANGEYMLAYIHAQDVLAWETQGRIADRTAEHLGSSDRGVTMLRRMLLRELKKMEAGTDPMNVFRDPAHNELLELPLEVGKDMNSDGVESLLRRGVAAFSPVIDDVIRILSQSPAATARS
jgi:5,5'-dehydrodivanillate O-demethylase oxygenase subunit